MIELCGAGAKIQGSVRAGQAVYALNHIPSPWNGYRRVKRVVLLSGGSRAEICSSSSPVYKGWYYSLAVGSFKVPHSQQSLILCHCDHLPLLLPSSAFRDPCYIGPTW